VDEEGAVEGVVVVTIPIFDSRRTTRKPPRYPRNRSHHLLPTPPPQTIQTLHLLHLLLPSPQRSLPTLYAAIGP
jgi:hypothetical protein